MFSPDFSELNCMSDEKQRNLQSTFSLKIGQSKTLYQLAKPKIIFG